MPEGFTYFDMQRRLDFVFNDPQKCKRRVHLRDYLESRHQICSVMLPPIFIFSVMFSFLSSIDVCASFTALARWSAYYLCQQFSPSLIKGPSMGLLPMCTTPSWAETGFQDGFDQSRYLCHHQTKECAKSQSFV